MKRTNETCTECGAKIKSKKALYRCGKCKRIMCEKCVVYYVDGNNIAITLNSPPYCKPCIQRKSKIVEKNN